MSTAPSPILVEQLGKTGGPHAREVNGVCGARLEKVLSERSTGRALRLRAPRAGYGKTHLLEQCRRRLASTHFFVSLLSFSDPDWRIGSVRRHFQSLDAPLPAAGGVGALDLQIRRILAKGLEPLVESGRIPCADQQAAMEMLRDRPTEILDFHHPQAAIAQWFAQNFDSLRESLVQAIGQSAAVRPEALAEWVSALFDYVRAAPGDGSRLGALCARIDRMGETDVLQDLLALWSGLKVGVVVVDEFDDWAVDPGRLASAMSGLAGIRTGLPGLHWVISVNDDTWEATFERHLSSGIRDRWSELTCRLEPLSMPQVRALLASHRLADESCVEAVRHWPPADRYARRVLRHALEEAT
jgi:hypothetical protein